MKSKEGIACRPEGERQFATAQKRHRLKLISLVAVFVLLSLGVAAAYSSLYTFHVSLKESSFFTLHPSLKSDSDTIVNTRWRIQPTVPLVVNDLDTSVLDLRRPDNIIQTVELEDR